MTDQVEDPRRKSSNTPSTTGDADIQDKATPSDNPLTTPMLRPAQGAWDKTYSSAKGSTGATSPQPPRPLAAAPAPSINASAIPASSPAIPASSPPIHASSIAAHTRSKEKHASSAASPGNRTPHPEDSQRSHVTVVGGHTSTQIPPSFPVAPAPPPPTTTPTPASSEHYRHSTHPQHTSPRLYPRGSTRDVAPRSSPSRDSPQQSQAHPTRYYPSSPQGSGSAHPSYSHYSERRPYSSARTQPPEWVAAGIHDEAVVLLMEDVRCAGPEPDYQLAEVSAHLLPGEDGGWWADGEDIIRALQGTPSRLEGAAKVFARRGKYRHCFARFTDDGAMECQQSSLMVSRDKTIELIIEPNPEGRPFPTVQSSHSGAYSRPYTSQRQSYEYPASSQAPQNAYPSPHYLSSVQSNRKRAATVSDIDEHPPKRSRASPPEPAQASSATKRLGPNTPATRNSSQTTSPLSRSSASGNATAADSLGSSTTRPPSPDTFPPEPASTYSIFPGSEQLTVSGGKAPKEIVNAAIVAYLRSHIQTEDGYMEFAASKGRLLPIPDLLKGYRFATRMVNTWANRKTPPTLEGCSNKRITKNHVLQALFRQTSWGSDCEQTLQLAERYGPGGIHEVSQVVDILCGKSLLPDKPGDKGRSQGQGSVALLDYLKDVDKEYKARPDGGLRQSKSKDANGNGTTEGKE